MISEIVFKNDNENFSRINDDYNPLIENSLLSQKEKEEEEGEEEEEEKAFLNKITKMESLINQLPEEKEKSIFEGEIKKEIPNENINYDFIKNNKPGNKLLNQGELIHANIEASSKENKNKFLKKKTRRKKRKNDKESNINVNTEKKKDDNKTTKKDNKDNLIKTCSKAPFLYLKKMIENFGNIKLNNVNLNIVFGGITQNELAFNSKLYQILCFDEEVYVSIKKNKSKKNNNNKDDNQKIKKRKREKNNIIKVNNKTKLENAKPENEKYEKYFYYFLTRDYKFLYKKYHQNDKLFNIEGQNEIIYDFKTLNDVLECRKKSKIYYKNVSEQTERKNKKFLEMSSVIFNDFKDCIKRQPRYEEEFLKFQKKIKSEIPRFENYLNNTETIKDRKKENNSFKNENFFKYNITCTNAIDTNTNIFKNIPKINVSLSKIRTTINSSPIKQICDYNDKEPLHYVNENLFFNEQMTENFQLDEKDEIDQEDILDSSPNGEESLYSFRKNIFDFSKYNEE